MALEQSVLSELADALKSADGVDLGREAVRLVLQELVESEAAGAIDAEQYERSETSEAPQKYWTRVMPLVACGPRLVHSRWG